jgi:hypothetical protein
MPFQSTMTVSGLDGVIKLLDEAPATVVSTAFVKAADAAGEVIVSALWPRTPIDIKAAMNAAHGGKGALVTQLDHFVELDKQLRGVSLEIGFGSLGHLALWVEYGHRMVTHKPGRKQVGDVPAHPFMRPAFDASAEAAIDAFGEALAEALRSAF